MARRNIPTMSPSDEVEGEDKDALPGGAPGIPEEAVVEPSPMKVAERNPEEIAKLPPPKLYRVARDGKVLYGGVPTVMKAGKTLSEATHDLHTLRSQGIILEEVPHEK